MSESEGEDELQRLKDDILARKLGENARRAKAGKKPMHPGLAKKTTGPSAKKSRSPSLPKPESGNMDDSAMSFEEWKSTGYTVKKGERSQISDVLGIPQFTMNQVHRINPAWAAWKKRQ